VRVCKARRRTSHERADKVIESVDQMVNKGREFIKDKQAVLTEATEAGRTAMHCGVSSASGSDGRLWVVGYRLQDSACDTTRHITSSTV
jgi:hypothetical protein